MRLQLFNWELILRRTNTVRVFVNGEEVKPVGMESNTKFWYQVRLPAKNQPVFRLNSGDFEYDGRAN